MSLPESGGKFDMLETAAPTTTKRAIIHVDMDAFYASVEQHDDPSLAGKAVLVGGLGRRGVVAAASYEARQFGVHSAMPMQRARRLCPGGVYLRPRLDRYRAVSRQVFDLFREVTPVVEGLSLDEAFLDVSGSLKLLGDIETIGAGIRDAILEHTGLHASVGMAHNKFLAKLASDALKPRGFLHVREQQVQDFLDPMPVSRLWGIGKRTEPKLRVRGILTIGQLRRANPLLLSEVFGRRVAHFQRLARGEDEREVQQASEDKSISHEVTFDQDRTDSRDLLSELQHQSEAVMTRVRAQQLEARTIHVKIRDPRFKTYSRSRTLRHGTQSTQTLFRVAASLFEKWRSEHVGTAVRLIGVGVSGLADKHLETDIDDQGQGQIDGTLDEINRRYGNSSIAHGLAFERKLKKD
jgi:DNA polymerase-4